VAPECRNAVQWGKPSALFGVGSCAADLPSLQDRMPMDQSSIPEVVSLRLPPCSSLKSLSWWLLESARCREAARPGPALEPRRGSLAVSTSHIKLSYGA